MHNILFVAAGGALGSAARYTISVVIKNYSAHAFPIATFAVNIIGCFIIGFIYMLFGTGNHRWFLLAVGFCGGFTTFSSFAIENVHLTLEGNISTSLIYIILSVIFGYLAVFTGMYAAKVFN